MCVIFGSLDRFQEVSAFSTSVVAFCLPCNPRQSSLSQDESCRANLKTPDWSAGKPAGLQAVYKLYSVSFFLMVLIALCT